MNEAAAKLQREIHASKGEQPYKSGQLAALLGVPMSRCAWVAGSSQHRAFEAGYLREDSMAKGIDEIQQAVRDLLEREGVDYLELEDRRELFNQLASDFQAALDGIDAELEHGDG